MIGTARDRTYGDIQAIHRQRVGLVLGTARYLKGGYHNPFFKYRIRAAAALFFAGKIEYIIVSGDNRYQSYNEPRHMKSALIELGIPKSKIYCDYAGFRTLDSVVRAWKIFGQNKLTIISQKFHNQRAIFIGKAHGIDAIGFNADDVTGINGLMVHAREYLANVKAVMDIYILRKKPKFLGKMISIGETT